MSSDGYSINVLRTNAVLKMKCFGSSPHAKENDVGRKAEVLPRMISPSGRYPNHVELSLLCTSFTYNQGHEIKKPIRKLHSVSCCLPHLSYLQHILESLQIVPLNLLLSMFVCPPIDVILDKQMPASTPVISPALVASLCVMHTIGWRHLRSAPWNSMGPFHSRGAPHSWGRRLDTLYS